MAAYLPASHKAFETKPEQVKSIKGSWVLIYDYYPRSAFVYFGEKHVEVVDDADIEGMWLKQVRQTLGEMNPALLEDDIHLLITHACHVIKPKVGAVELECQVERQYTTSWFDDKRGQCGATGDQDIDCFLEEQETKIDNAACEYASIGKAIKVLQEKQANLQVQIRDLERHKNNDVFVVPKPE